MPAFAFFIVYLVRWSFSHRVLFFSFFPQSTRRVVRVNAWGLLMPLDTIINVSQLFFWLIFLFSIFSAFANARQCLSFFIFNRLFDLSFRLCFLSFLSLLKHFSSAVALNKINRLFSFASQFSCCGWARSKFCFALSSELCNLILTIMLRPKALTNPCCVAWSWSPVVAKVYVFFIFSLATFFCWYVYFLLDFVCRFIPLQKDFGRQHP